MKPVLLFLTAIYACLGAAVSNTASAQALGPVTQLRTGDGVKNDDDLALRSTYATIQADLQSSLRLLESDTGPLGRVARLFTDRSTLRPVDQIKGLYYAKLIYNMPTGAVASESVLVRIEMEETGPFAGLGYVQLVPNPYSSPYRSDFEYDLSPSQLIRKFQYMWESAQRVNLRAQRDGVLYNHFGYAVNDLGNDRRTEHATTFQSLFRVTASGQLVGIEHGSAIPGLSGPCGTNISWGFGSPHHIYTRGLKPTGSICGVWYAERAMDLK